MWPATHRSARLLAFIAVTFPLTGLTNVPVAAAGTNVTVGDNAPTTDHWNMAAVELPGDGA